MLVSFGEPFGNVDARPLPVLIAAALATAAKTDKWLSIRLLADELLLLVELAAAAASAEFFLSMSFIPCGVAFALVRLEHVDEIEAVGLFGEFNCAASWPAEL